MSFVVYVFGSGLAFLGGAVLVFISAVMFAGRSSGWSRVATVVALFGLILVILSAAPQPFWFYAIAITGTIGWLLFERFGRTGGRKWQIGIRAAVALTWLIAGLVEAGYEIAPKIDVRGSPPLHLLGDSMSAAGTAGGSDSWPQLLADSHSIVVHNHSRVGATVAKALHVAEEAQIGDGIILLEVGGNDLLGSTTPEDFERDLDSLLMLSCRPGRTVLMCELPLPPLRNRFGAIQRRLAKKHGASLIPKRILMSVLTAKGATLDSIHLTPSGQELMAQRVWQIIQPAYANR